MQENKTEPPAESGFYIHFRSCKARVKGGIVDKIIFLLLAIAGVFGFVACDLSNAWISGIVIITLTFLVLHFCNRMLAFAERDPIAASMDGEQILEFEKLKAKKKAKKKHKAKKKNKPAPEGE